VLWTWQERPLLADNASVSFPRRLLPGLPVALALLAFAPGLNGGFVADDAQAITGNPVVTGGLPVSAAFTRSFWGHPLDVPPPTWRPLATLSFRLDYALWGPSSLAYHLISLACYLILVHLVHRLARRWLDQRAALWAACLFAVLPVHVENVTSLVGRADTLALIAMVTALLWLRPAVSEAKHLLLPRLGGAVIAQFAALLCKESSAVLPAIVGVLALAHPGASTWRARLRAQIPAALLALTVAAYLATRLALMPATFSADFVLDDVTRGASASGRVLYALELAAHYFRLMVAPADLCIGRKYAMVAAPHGLSLLSAVGLLLLIAALWASVRDLRRGRPAFWLCAGIAWAPFSSLLFVVPEAMADRFLLAPTLFASLAIAGPLAAWSVRGRVHMALAALLVAVQGAFSAFYTTRWRTDLVLFEHAVTACPASLHDHVRFATLLSRSRRPAESAWHFAIAMDARRHFPNPWHHPAIEAELREPAEARLLRLPELLHVSEEPRAFYDYFTAYLELQQAPVEAALIRRVIAQRWPGTPAP
jgi:protein O-mannosyl-transferase